MADRQNHGPKATGQDQGHPRRRNARAGRDRRKESGRSGGTFTEQAILTFGGNLRYGGGNARGIPTKPDEKQSR